LSYGHKITLNFLFDKLKIDLTDRERERERERERDGEKRENICTREILTRDKSSALRAIKKMNVTSVNESEN
jgi:hypothetical protein